MQYDYKITKDSAIRMLEHMRKDMPSITRHCTERVCIEIVTVSQKKYLTNANSRGGLNVVTGTGRKGVWYKLDSPSPGHAQVGNNVWYMKTHESPEIADRTIVPKTAKALFIPLTKAARKGYRRGMKWGEDFVMAKKAVLKYRPFLSPAIDDVMGNYSVINRIIQATLKARFDALEAANA